MVADPPPNTPRAWLRHAAAAAVEELEFEREQRLRASTRTQPPEPVLDYARLEDEEDEWEERQAERFAHDMQRDLLGGGAWAAAWLEAEVW